MKNRQEFFSNGTTHRVLIALAILFAISAPTNAQTVPTPGGTVITNQATVTYSDGTDSFSGVSNTVTITVASVAG
ncbi:MAG: hypothetical protein DMF69_01700, partial [Acidobacteria bacterium]